MFVLFCNDAPSHIRSDCLMYADDLKLYQQIQSPINMLTLQTDLDSLCVWSAAWDLCLNPSKCKTITFTLRKSLSNTRRFSPGPVIAGFNVHIRCVMEFGSAIWGGAARSHILRLDRIQHKLFMWMAAHSNCPYIYLSGLYRFITSFWRPSH